MFKSYWYIAITFGLILISLQSYAHDGPEFIYKSQPDPSIKQSNAQKNLQKKSTAKQTERFDPIAAFKNIESAIRDLVPQKDKIADKKKNQREEDDLKAQKWMAIWAGLMFVATVATVIVTAIGVWLILRTLKYTRKAAKSAKKMVKQGERTAKAAEDSVKSALAAVRESRRSTELELQPYIVFGEFVTKYRPDGSETRFDFTAVLVVKNMGATPLTWAKFEINARIGDRANWDVNGRDFKVIGSTSDIPPGERRMPKFSDTFDISFLGKDVPLERVMILFTITTEQRDIFTAPNEHKRMPTQAHFHGFIGDEKAKRGLPNQQLDEN